MQIEEDIILFELQDALIFMCECMTVQIQNFRRRNVNNNSENIEDEIIYIQTEIKNDVEISKKKMKIYLYKY